MTESMESSVRRQAYIEMTKLVWENILDPLSTFAELVRGHDDQGFPLDQKEIAAVLRLLVLGAYTEPKFYCTVGCSYPHFSGEELEGLFKNWNKG
jgi:hypothetical protein